MQTADIMIQPVCSKAHAIQKDMVTTGRRKVQFSFNFMFPNRKQLFQNRDFPSNFHDSCKYSIKKAYIHRYHLSQENEKALCGGTPVKISFCPPKMSYRTMELE